MPMPEWLRLRRAGPVVPEQAAQWTKCPKCGEMIYRPDLAANLWLCTRCRHAFRMHAFDRISMLVDADFTEIGTDVLPGDPLQWSDRTPYPQKLQRDREKSKLTEGVVCGFGEIGGFPTALGVMDFNFRGGTMGTVVGERVALLFEGARDRRVPCIVVTASGGARMEEGMLALMQMAKTTLAVRRFRDAGGYYISVLTDPTTGGVSASFAFQADVVVGEARAAIGFAGRRVIEQTIRQKLPDNFQTAEFLLEKGALDMVVERSALKGQLVRLLDYGTGAQRPANGRASGTTAVAPPAVTETRA
ncbi:MAG: acetyl-CoA carboxylase, carboxyltransferase subunit beta [Candidatus Eremiobacteraeota bacterium]|nr:acetyl-CoA carboxylase, carboxyltransferase subunit beta [Candidatus Eremiobacteraeota bacterium]